MVKSPSGLGIHNGGGIRDFVCLHLQWTWLAICFCTVIQGLQSYTPTQGQKPRHLAQGKAEESPYGQISQLKVHQLLSAGPQVVYPVGLNGCNQSVIIDLLELLHSGSSITTDKHPHLQINIPLPTPEEPECTTPLLDRVHATPIDTIPKTPWKPRITLTAEVDDLLNWGMADDYNHEPEHSAIGEEAATGTDIPLPQKAEVPAPPLDTSSQVSVEEMETSLESNPINIYPPMAVCRSCSDSPMVDLMELLADANPAANYMLSIKRSLDLQRQWAIWEFKASLYQQEAEEAMTNERAKIIHSRKDLDAKVGCTKAVMKAKYDYRMAVQEARMIRCSQLPESEATYLEALSENAFMRSTRCATLCREHVKHMHELEEQALREEIKSHQDFPSTCQASQRKSVYLLPHLVRAITFITSIYSICQDTPGMGTAICSHFSQARTQTVPMAKKVAFLARSMGKHVHGWNFLQGLTGRTVKLQKKRDSWLVHFPKAQSCRCLQSWLWPHKRSQITLLHDPPLGLDPWQHWWPLQHL